MIFFTADTHFGHENIIKLCNRPFSSVQEMDEAMVKNWNEKVKKDDTVYIVGDFVWKASDLEKYASELNGKKILIQGNHDNWVAGGQFNKYFAKISKYQEIYVDGRLITLCHYPMLEWKNSLKAGTDKVGYLIYGHIHNCVKPQYEYLFSMPNAFNAGVEINNYAPVSFEELIENNLKFTANCGLLKNNGEV